MSEAIMKQIADGRTDRVVDLAVDASAANGADADGVSLLQWCAYYGDVSAIRFLLDKGADLSALGDNIGLNGAAFHGHWQLVQFLIEQGADVNHAQPDTGETALHSALCKANRPVYDLVVRILLAYGADPNLATKPGVETGAFMRDCRTKGETPLHRAAAFGSEAAVDLLVGAGAVIDARDVHGETPLSWASWHLRPDAILRKLCHGNFRISPARGSTYDHGSGWGPMGVGTPHLPVRD